MHTPLLQDVVLILGLSVLISVLFFRVKIPAIIAFLATGIIAGPYGLKLISVAGEVEQMAEIGVIFLLFVIGIEFSIKGLSKVGRIVLWGGLMQVGGTIALTFLFCWQLGLPYTESVFMGFLLSLSSTAIVLKMLIERGELNAPHGRIALAILIAQDIIVVPMMLVTPLIAGQSDNVWLSVGELLLRIIAVVAIVYVLARFIVPFVLRQVVQTKSRELFILSTVVMCFATAGFTSQMGLSLALGAFFAGLIISESEYSHQAMANIIPFREIFISFFFVSIGMLLDLSFFADNWLVVIALTLLVVVAKSGINMLVAIILKYPPRTSIIASLHLFQVGEFAFVLSVAGMQYELLQENTYQIFLSVSILTMGITPFVIASATHISDFLIRAPLPKEVRNRLIARQHWLKETQKPKEELSNHLIIIGYGVNGENLARAARTAGIPYIVVELDPEIIEKCRRDGVPVIFGDAAAEEVLAHLAVPNAGVVVIAISDPDATRRILSAIRHINLTAYIVVRTRYVKEVQSLLNMGADEVIPEEFETSIEIFTRVLMHYLVPRNDIEELTEKIREGNYSMLRDNTGAIAGNRSPLPIPDMEIIVLKVNRARAKLVGKSIGEIGFRSNHGVGLLAVQREGRFFTRLEDNLTLEFDDKLYLAGNAVQMARFNKFLVS